MTTQSNAPAWAELGIKAGKELTTMSRSGDKGEALAVVVLIGALRDGYEMQYITPRGKDMSDDPVTFTLATYGNNIVSENGKNDTKAISARKSAMYADLFGLSEYTQAQDAVINRALVSANYLHANKAEPTINSKGQLVVPYELITAAPAADASDNVKTQYEAMKGKPVSLDGKKGTSLRELRNKAVAAQPRKTRKAKTTERSVETDFRAAVKFMATVMQAINTSDESPVSFKHEDEQMLFELQAGIAAYFAANPLEAVDATNTRRAA